MAADKALDYKKEYKDLYMPKNKPMLITVPDINFIMVDGKGDPNNNPSFESGVELLYGLSYAIKMSKMKGNKPEGYFEYVVPPLEGLWSVNSGEFSLDIRDNWIWTIMIRQPDFVDENVFKWACVELNKKKTELDIKRARLERFKEGLCVQIMHNGPYSTEPESMKKLYEFIGQEGLKDGIGIVGKHHEIYISDPRKAKPETMKTVLRHPLMK
ncbi:MAG: GyrI-like domain-containing protein [Bacillota bacterium]|nr:GyrI-like domain-containing protein [Bacillota bacterium]